MHALRAGSTELIDVWAKLPSSSIRVVIEQARDPGTQKRNVAPIAGPLSVSDSTGDPDPRS